MSSEDQASSASRTPESGITRFFNLFGLRVIRLNNSLGAIAVFFFRSLVMIFRFKQIPEIVQQIYFIGAKSAQIVMLVGFFTGMVMGLQLYYVLIKFGSAGNTKDILDGIIYDVEKFADGQSADDDQVLLVIIVE